MFISVIVPVYNVEEYLDKCLESLLNQHYSDMEIVVVDDKSTDDSLNIAKKYEKYTNVKVIAKERNSGLSDTRNVGHIFHHLLIWNQLTPLTVFRFVCTKTSLDNYIFVYNAVFL